MSEDRRIAVIRRAYVALGERDRDEYAALVEEIMHPECEWIPFLTGVEGRAYRGHAGMFEFFDDFLGTFSPSYEIDEVRPVGPDTVVVLGAMHLRGRESGAEVTQELGVLFEFDDGLILRGTASDHATALAAAQEVLERAR